MTPNDIIFISFEDELEKISGMRRVHRIMKSQEKKVPGAWTLGMRPDKAEAALEGAAPDLMDALRRAIGKTKRRVGAYPGGPSAHAKRVQEGLTAKPETPLEAARVLGRGAGPRRKK